MKNSDSLKKSEKNPSKKKGEKRGSLFYKKKTTYKKNFNKKRTLKHLPQKKVTSQEKSHIVRIFLEMLHMIKLYHWKTTSYSQHKATDELHGKMEENVDRFVEVLLGKDASRIQMMEKRMDLLDMNTKQAFKDRLLGYRKFLTDMNIYFDETQDTDLLNIRDELLADLNQFLYLFSFQY